MDTLNVFNRFHDWYMDTIQVSKERETLTLGLYLQDQRASVSFVGMNRCVLENLGLQNIVYAIEILEPGTTRFEKAQQILSKAERWTDGQPGIVAQVFSTCGAELVIEFDSIEIESQVR
ncbi:hypothetical protein [Paraburkholderia hospita]|jgi:hypothetical protein|uniref:Uncharacterized protein n=1 Tax=Paraburkholderia hospita TaxID=169430 RepID=A0ABP2PPU6_9BURK|nr:hypothetical protein [Paraburkholderia hospita]EIM99593.1 hypothetical protein WQE_18194 [Paraburkholderia hospita]OUL72628.1 hypothetical protein CA602_42850 [Paraburkholderia hospita]OUL79169.1 hypothetical protein CA601_35165 [Paraburkholderia hospita]OUL96249.1 hypothetical protein CA603_05785 [Paraburkholderia hospita]